MRVLPLFLALCVACGSCSAGDGADQVSVFAAASLTDVLNEVAGEFESLNPNFEIQLNFAGSTTLRTQLLEGAPADVVMLANVSTMDDLRDAEVVSASSIAAGNLMVIAVANSAGPQIDMLSDLANDSLLVGLCAPDVPCGSTARTILNAAGVNPSLDTNEPDVRSLLSKISSGELDAGIVYKTDLASADQPVRGIDIDPSLYQPNLYPIASVPASPNDEGADAFVEFVLSDAGQEILSSYGFLTAAEAQGQ